MAYDETRHRVVLFGGQPGPAACGVMNDTWEWDGTSWTQMFPATSPPPRSTHALAFCPARSKVVLFGGADCSGGLSDTWEWDGANWAKQATPVAPPARIFGAMAPDPSGGVVLFGGAIFRSQKHFSDTWVWNGQWVQRTPAASPPSRKRHAMALDGRRGRVVLYGGDRIPTRLGDTWEWDGGSWNRRTPASSPTLLANGVALAYDGDRDRVVLYQFALPGSSESWEWDGGDWARRTPPVSPPPRYPTAMVYDWRRSRVVLFGGQGLTGDLSDTWEYFTQSPASYSTFGSGCAGSAGVPRLSLAGPFERPWIGGVFTVVLGNLPPGNGTVLALGASSSRWGGVSLPFALGGIGMTGCTLLSSIEVAVPLANSGGVASLTLPIPNDPTLVGGAFYNQGFVLDPTANALGMVVSSGGVGTVGAR